MNRQRRLLPSDKSTMEHAQNALTRIGSTTQKGCVTIAITHMEGTKRRLHVSIQRENCMLSLCAIAVIKHSNGDKKEPKSKNQKVTSAAYNNNEFSKNTIINYH